MPTIKETTFEIYSKHLNLASTNSKIFRKTVINEVVTTTGCSEATASTNYNLIKKLYPIEGVGRQIALKKKESIIDENNCFSVLEIKNDIVGRCYSFLMQGDASEFFDEKIKNTSSIWVLIKGLGPISGEPYKLEFNEIEIKRYSI